MFLIQKGALWNSYSICTPKLYSLLVNERDQLLLTTRVRDPSSICCTYTQNIGNDI